MKPLWQKALESALGKERVAVDPANRLLYARDMMSGGLLEEKARREPHLPHAVCWPESVEDIRKILAVARRHRVPVVPFGAGSGVSGGTVPVKGGIMLDLKRLDRLGAIEERQGRFFVTAESGIIGQHLERDLNAGGFTLGHFPSSMLCATVGGYLACRSAGQLSSKYGKIEDMTDAVEVVLASGEVVRFGGAVKKFPQVRSTDLFVGSEGCLGVITRARFRVFPLPPATLYRGLNFRRIEDALLAIRKIMQAGLRPSVVRLYDPLDTILLKHGTQKAGRKKSSSDGWLTPLLLRRPSLIQKLAERATSEVLLILAFEGEPELAREMENRALQHAAALRGKDLGPGPGLHWRDHRFSVSFKMPKLFANDCFVDTIEVATTWENLPALYDGMRKALGGHALVLAHFSHAYAEGCSIYFTVAGKCRDPERDLKTYAEIWNDAMETCLTLGATISHHHGIGLLKAKYLPRELGGAMPLFREMKKKLDPWGIMNPGKMGLDA
jgi:alkyldihydroxyacetonephosphate synthase